MLFIIEIIAGLFLLGVVAVAVFIMMQPKHRFVFDVKYDAAQTQICI